MTNLLNLDNPGITIFGIKIYYYALILVSGIVAAIFITIFLGKKRGVKSDDVLTYAIVCILCGFLGARIYFFLFPYAGQTSDWSEFFNFRSGGLALYGAVIGGALGMVATALATKKDFFAIADSAIPGLMIAQAIGRWGNFVNQEAYGALVTNENLQWFPYAVHLDNGTWHQATFFYESTWNLIGAAVLIFLFLRHYRKGLSLAFYSLYYGLGRFWIEGLRTDSLYLNLFGWETGLRISQFISVFLMIAGIAGFCIIYKKEIAKLFRRKSVAEDEESRVIEPVDNQPQDSDRKET